MAGPFHSLSISRSGMDTYQVWLDAIADNIANVNTITSTDEPSFRERLVVARAVDGERPEGVQVDRIEFGPDQGKLMFDPTHPLADEDGMVKLPSVDLSQQMTHMIVAQRAYQANTAAFRAARDAYQTALEIGQR